MLVLYQVYSSPQQQTGSTMTDHKDAIEKLMRSQALARKFHQVAQEHDDDIRISFMAALIFYAGCARAMNLPMHDAISGFMSAYKDADKFMTKVGE